MIRTRNTGEFILPMGPAITTAGTKVTAAAGVVDTYTAPFAGSISAFTAAFGVMGTDGTGSPTQDLQVDIQINGTSIFTAAANAIVWAHATQLGTANTPTQPTSYGTLTTNPPTFNRGDEIEIVILQLLNGTSPTQPKDLTVWLGLQVGEEQSMKPTIQGQLADYF